MGNTVLAVLALAGTSLAFDANGPYPVAAATRIKARQDPTPTLTLGPRDDYLQSPTATANPTGTQLAILPTDITDNVVPEGGLDFFFGPDLSSALASSLDSHCADGASEECISSLVSDLSQGRTAELQVRVLGIDDALFLGVAVLVCAVGVIIEAVRLLDGEKPVRVHMPSSDVVQLQSQTGAILPIVTSSGAQAITITPTLPSTSVEGPTTASIYTLTADDGNGHASGATVVAVPTQAASAADQILAISGQCPHGSAKKRQSNIDYGPMGGAASLLLSNSGPGGVASALGLLANSQLPQLRDEAAKASWDTLRAVADTLPDFSTLSSAYRDTITTGAWQAAYQWCIEGLEAAAERLVYDPSLWVEDSHDDDNDGDPACPADAPRGVDAPSCDDPACLGVDGLCTGSDLTRCECLPSTSYDSLYGSVDEWEAGQYVLESLLSEDGAGCVDTLVTLDSQDFASLVDVWCSGLDLASDVSRSLTPADIHTDAYDGYTFKFEWKDKEGDCSATCGEIYHSFESGNQCSYGSHSFAQSGHQDLTCGEASFEISVDDTPPEDALPNPDGGTLGGPCDVEQNMWACSTDNTQPLWCSCDNAGTCLYTSYGACANGAAACYVQPNCGQLLMVQMGACCG